MLYARIEKFNQIMIMYDGKWAYEKLQPWSTFVLKTRLPLPVFDKMMKITDEIVENGVGSDVAKEAVGAGEMKDQFLIDSLDEDLREYFLKACKEYVIQAYCQTDPENKERVKSTEWITKINLMWINSQKDNEYFPLHSHSNAHLSTVMYLKIPKYLPANSPHSKPGAIEFMSNTSRNHIWGAPSLMIQPQIGDFYIFTIDQQHCIYPFQTEDGNGERRSVSFNAEFTNK